MAEFDPWDDHLEAITAKLDQMTSGKLRGRAVLKTEGGWSVEFRGAGRSVTVRFGHAAGPGAMPGDYARAIIYGCDFSPLGNEGNPVGFGKTLTVREGFGWDEQTLREVVLEAIGILRFLLGVAGAGDVTFEDFTRAGPVALARQTVHRRKKR